MSSKPTNSPHRQQRPRRSIDPIHLGKHRFHRSETNTVNTNHRSFDRRDSMACWNTRRDLLGKKRTMMCVSLRSTDQTIEWTSVEFHSHANSTPTRAVGKNSNSSGDDRRFEKTFLSEIRVDIAFDDLEEKISLSLSVAFGSLLPSDWCSCSNR